MNATTFFDELRLRWRTFVAVFAGCVLVAVLAFLLGPTRYVSSVQLLVTAKGTTTANSYQDLEVETARANSYVALATTEAVTQRVVDDLGLAGTASDLATRINATVVPRTTIIDVRVSASSPDEASAIADSLARELSSYTAAIETPTGSDDRQVEIAVVNSAGTAVRQTPGIAFYVLTGVLAGILFGAVAVWVRSSTDPRVRTARDATAASGLPVLGLVPIRTATTEVDVESYRALRTVFRSSLAGIRPGGSVVQMVATGTCDVSGVIANLGRALTAGDTRVLLVDADLRSALLSTEFGCAGSSGITDVLEGTESVEHVVRPTGDGSVDVLPLGSVTDAGSDLFESRTMRALIGDLRDRYGHVLVSTSATGPLSDFVAVTGFVDAAVLCVVRGSTRRRDLTRTVEHLRSARAHPVGVVLCVPSADDDRSRDVVDVAETASPAGPGSVG